MSDVDLNRLPITLPDRRGQPPNTEMISACEALTWIAFGDALTEERFSLDQLTQFDLWCTTHLDDLLRALVARASDEPSTPLDSAFSRAVFLGDYVGRSCAPTLRALRARARQREGRLVSFRELRDQLAVHYARLEHGDELLNLASSRLRGALASERLVAFGQHQGLEHEAIQATYFMDPTVEITWWNTAESKLGRRRFDNVQFRTQQILALWPSTPATVDSASVERIATQPNPVVPEADLRNWYIARRDSWPANVKHPSEAEDLVAAHAHCTHHKVTREAVRAVRAKYAPEIWKAHGRRKSARK